MSTNGRRVTKQGKDNGYMPATGHGMKEETPAEKRKQAELIQEGLKSFGGEYRPAIQELLQSYQFDVFIGAVIVLNSIFLGVEISLSLEGRDDSIVLVVVESIFLLIYIVELALRFFADGLCKALRSHWVQFDLLLVLLGAVTSWVLEPLSFDGNGLGPVMVLRSLRLLRLTRTVRIIRMLAKYREFYLLLRGLMKSINLMACSIFMIVIILYAFACLGVELINKHDLASSNGEFRDQVDRYFTNLPVTMLTLVRFVVLDNTSEVYAKLIENDPWLFPYFGLVILTLSMVFFHVVAAVTYQCILEQACLESDIFREEQEHEWADFFRALKQMFLRMDTDASGCVSLQEVKKMHPSDMKKVMAALDCQDATELFTKLDADGNGSISITEFFDGLLQAVINKNQQGNVMQMRRSEKQIETITWKIKDVVETLHALDIRIGRMDRHFKDGTSYGDMGSNLSGGSNDLRKQSLRGQLHKSGTAKDRNLPEAEHGASALELTERLQKIWREAVQHTLQLTMQEVEELQGATRQEVSKSAKALTATPARKKKKRNGRTVDEASDASDVSVLSDLSDASSRKDVGSKARNQMPLQGSNVSPRSQASAVSSQHATV